MTGKNLFGVGKVQAVFFEVGESFFRVPGEFHAGYYRDNYLYFQADGLILRLPLVIPAKVGMPRCLIVVSRAFGCGFAEGAAHDALELSFFGGSPRFIHVGVKGNYLRFSLLDAFFDLFPCLIGLGGRTLFTAADFDWRLVSGSFHFPLKVEG